MNIKKIFSFIRDEKGSILILAVLIMSVMFVLGTFFMSLSKSEVKIATNQKNSTATLYLAEAGWNLALHELASTNFGGATHASDGVTPLEEATLTTDIPNTYIDNSATTLPFNDLDNGDYVWQWQPGDQHENLTHTGLPEEIRCRVYHIAGSIPSQFAILCTSTLGTFKKVVEVKGYSEALFNYAIFDAGDLSEFVRGQNQTITGKIHANGNIFFRPSGTTLRIDSPSLTCGGKMIRSRDAWGRPYESGTVYIKNSLAQDVVMGVSPFFDSDNPNWTDNDPMNAIEGALEKWDGLVKDRLLGASTIEPPAIRENGYYDENAMIKIHGTSILDNNGSNIQGQLNNAIREVTFYNPGMSRNETVMEINLSLLRDPNQDGNFSDSNYPDNGLLFSNRPVRIINGDELYSSITIVSTNSIYTKGNYNRVNKKASALISSGRIWHLSSSWLDSKATYPLNQRIATNTEIYAALVDGVPTVDEANYAGGSGDCWPNSDDLLETWGSGRTLKKRGSIVHLQNANMTAVVPNNPGPNEVGWRVHNQYDPPYRDYGYDPTLSQYDGQPPYMPFGGHIFSWREITVN